MKKEKFTTKLLVGILTVIVIWAAMSSCSSYKHGCEGAYGTVGHGAEYKPVKKSFRMGVKF